MSGQIGVQCTACGQWVPETTRFCGNCGTEVSPSVELYTDPNAVQPHPSSNPPDGGTAGPYAYGSSIGTGPPGPAGPGPAPGDYTIYTGPVAPGGSGVVTGAPLGYAPQQASSGGAGLKIAALVLGALVLVAGVGLVVVLVNQTPPTTTQVSQPDGPGSPGGAAGADGSPPSSKAPLPKLTVKSSASSVQSGQAISFQVVADSGAPIKTTRVLITSNGTAVATLEEPDFPDSFPWTAPEVTDPKGQDLTVTAEAVTLDGTVIKALNTITVHVNPKAMGATIPDNIRQPIDDVYTAMVAGDWATVRARLIVNSFREDGYNMIRGYFLLPSSATPNGDGSYNVHTWIIVNEDWSQAQVNTFPNAEGAVGGAGQKSGAYCLNFRVQPGGTITQIGGPLQRPEYVPGFRTAEQAAAYAGRPC